ncbi:isoprenylcysteine carboxylmethyltransferase family protein [Candidatus Woesearchaeota archaeon]|nr:isoprenylcysteine carboxylmethyltransferase family protein [Candidatus Woesearchaeota archaeon]
MVNMIKVLIAVFVLELIIGIAILGKNLTRALIFRTAKTKNNEGIFLEAATGALAAIISIVYYTQNKPDATILMWLGLIVFFCGGILQFIARKQLFEDKTFEERARQSLEAATTGIYSVIRHPSKTALLLMLLGICLSMGSYWSLGLLFVLFLPSVLYRISQEEELLLDEFNDRWLAYKEDTKKLIPYIL